LVVGFGDMEVKRHLHLARRAIGVARRHRPGQHGDGTESTKGICMSDRFVRPEFRHRLNAVLEASATLIHSPLECVELFR
jgi:hypothetical protein